MEHLTPSDKLRRSIFISHAYADNGACRKLAMALRDRGYAVWLDLEQEYTGREISQVVRDALIASDALLVVLSTAALQSAWVREEFAYFRDYPNRTRPFVSVKIDDCQLRAVPRLALPGADANRPVELEDLAAIDAVHLATDEVISRIDYHLMNPNPVGRINLTTLTERKFVQQVQVAIRAIYGSGTLAEPEHRMAGSTVLDLVVSNSYTLFPGRYIFETKVRRSPASASQSAETAVRKIIHYSQSYAASLRQKGIDEEVFAFLFTPAEVPTHVRAEALRHNVRIFDGCRLVSLLRDNGFDVEL